MIQQLGQCLNDAAILKFDSRKINFGLIKRKQDERKYRDEIFCEFISNHSGNSSENSTKTVCSSLKKKN